jgi:ATP-dependent RNA helicase DDX35
MCCNYCVSIDVIIVDEAHERSLHSDIILGLLKKILRKRSDIKIIITSATINASSMKEFFETSTPNPTTATGAATSTTSDTCIVSIEGKAYPVDILYTLQPIHNYIQESVQTVIQIHLHEGAGDILVFLPSAIEIDTAIDILNNEHNYSDLVCLPLYSALPTSSQMLVFQRVEAKSRKCIIATNIAETSLTIDNIRFVIDSGFAKLNYFDVSSGVDSLLTAPISQASATQRCGRAGRTQPGKCFRLYTEIEYRKLSTFTIPEIQRTDLSWAVLQLKALGVADVLHFDFISSPSSDAMIHAIELLYSLHAIDNECNLTALGMLMSEMPLEPRLSSCLLRSYEYGCTEEILSIVSMCDVEYPFVTIRNHASSESKQRLLDCISLFINLDSDHITLLNVFKGFVDSSYSSSWCNEMMINYRMMSRAKEVSQIY